MAKETAPQKPLKKGESRDDRLKAALKANMARRKAQARARSEKADRGNDPEGHEQES